MSHSEPLENPLYSVKTKLSKSQLEGIGTVAAAYNEVEVYVDATLALVLYLGPEALHVTSRINGIEGKIEIIKTKFQSQKVPDDWRRMIAESLGENGFMGLKHLRDRVIHARALLDPNAPAVSSAKKGKFKRVLLDDAFLQGIYFRLVHMKYEMLHISAIANTVSIIEKTKHFTDVMLAVGPTQQTIDVVNAFREQIHKLAESQFPESLSLLQARQTHRLALPPLPELPEEDKDR